MDPSPARTLPRVEDLELLRCDFSYSRHVTWLEELQPDDFLCDWDTSCNQLSCACCWDVVCSCR